VQVGFIGNMTNMAKKSEISKELNALREEVRALKEQAALSDFAERKKDVDPSQHE
jgi:hypothetical protein